MASRTARRIAAEIVRASVWVEQEVAIAAFIQHALKRKIEVALILQRGIHHEGLREQLRIDAVPFDTAQDVLRDFRSRISGWRLQAAPEHALIARWRFKTERRTQDHHDYKLHVDLVNSGNVTVTDWRVRVEIPKLFVLVGQGRNETVTVQEDSTTLPPDEAKLYTGDTKADALLAAYYVDQRSHDTIRPDRPAMELSVWSGDALTWSETIPLSKLNEF